MQHRTLCVVSIAVLLGGCAASGVRVTYHSDPEGATLYDGGNPAGRTPLTLSYAADTFRQGKCFYPRPTSVKWASGATASISSLTICPAQGFDQRYTFLRPNVAGRDIDLNYALQLERNRILERQADAAEDAAAAQTMRRSTPSPSGPVICNSRQTGATVTTTCL